MKNKNSIIFLLSSVIVFFNCPAFYAQNKAVDSLLHELKSAKYDTTRARIFIGLSDELFLEKPDSTFLLCNMAIKLADKNIKDANAKEKKAYLQYKAEGLNNIGGTFAEKGKMDIALDYFIKSLAIREEIGNKIDISQSINNIAGMYNYIGKIDKAVEYYTKSLKIEESENNKKGIARQLNNLGAVFEEQGNIRLCLEYYQKSLRIQEEVDDKVGQAWLLGNLGLLYKDQGDTEEALKCFNKTLELQTKIGNKKGIGFALNNIGAIAELKGNTLKALELYNKSLELSKSIEEKGVMASSLNYIGLIYFKKGEMEKAFEYFMQCLQLQKETQSKTGTASAYGNISSIYFKQNKFKLAKAYSDSSLTLSKELGFPKNISTSERLMSRIDSALGNYNGAYEHYKQYIFFRDSINNANTRKATIRNQLAYEYEKKEAVIKEQQEKERAVSTEKNRIQLIIIWSIVLGLLMAIVFAIYVFRTLKTTRIQKIMIEEKQREMLDSIHYAKRIQKSLLPTEIYIDKSINRLKNS